MILTIFGLVVVTFMVTMYALERRGRIFIALFAIGCVLSGLYGVLAGAWPFGLAEGVWAFVAWRRYRAGGDGP